jgi:hypothetical protein
VDWLELVMLKNDLNRRTIRSWRNTTQGTRLYIAWHAYNIMTLLQTCASSWLGYGSHPTRMGSDNGCSWMETDSQGLWRMHDRGLVEMQICSICRCPVSELLTTQENHEPRIGIELWRVGAGRPWGWATGGATAGGEGRKSGEFWLLAAEH